MPRPILDKLIPANPSEPYVADAVHIGADGGTNVQAEITALKSQSSNVPQTGKIYMWVLRATTAQGEPTPPTIATSMVLANGQGLNVNAVSGWTTVRPEDNERGYVWEVQVDIFQDLSVVVGRPVRVALADFVARTSATTAGETATTANTAATEAAATANLAKETAVGAQLSAASIFSLRDTTTLREITSSSSLGSFAAVPTDYTNRKLCYVETADNGAFVLSTDDMANAEGGLLVFAIGRAFNRDPAEIRWQTTRRRFLQNSGGAVRFTKVTLFDVATGTAGGGGSTETPVDFVRESTPHAIFNQQYRATAPGYSYRTGVTQEVAGDPQVVGELTLPPVAGVSTKVFLRVAGVSPTTAPTNAQLLNESVPLEFLITSRGLWSGYARPPGFIVSSGVLDEELVVQLAIRDRKIMQLEASQPSAAMQKLDDDLSVRIHSEQLWERKKNPSSPLRIARKGGFFVDQNGANELAQYTPAIANPATLTLGTTGADQAAARFDPDAANNPLPGSEHIVQRNRWSLLTNGQRPIITARFSPAANWNTATGGNHSLIRAGNVDLFVLLRNAGHIEDPQAGIGAIVKSASAVGFREEEEGLATTDSNHFLDHTTFSYQGVSGSGPSKIRLRLREYTGDDLTDATQTGVFTTDVQVTHNNRAISFNIPVANEQSRRGTIKIDSAGALTVVFADNSVDVTGLHHALQVVQVLRTTVSRASTDSYTRRLSFPETGSQVRQSYDLKIAFFPTDGGTWTSSSFISAALELNGQRIVHNFRATAAELGMGNPAAINFVFDQERLGAFSKVQAGDITGVATVDPADLVGLNVDELGWGLWRHYHPDDEFAISAKVYAREVGIQTEEGLRRPLLPTESWAHLGNPNKIPPSKLPESVSTPGSVIAPLTITVAVPNSSVTIPQDIGRQTAWREKYSTIWVPVEYRKGGDKADRNNNDNVARFVWVAIPIDSLPPESSIQGTLDRWERRFIIDQYEGTAERVCLRIYQEDQRQGNPNNPIGNVHIHLCYLNHFNGYPYVSEQQGAVRQGNTLIAVGNDMNHFGFLEFGPGNLGHDQFGNQAQNAKQIYFEPRAQQGVAGADGADGRDGADGAPGVDGAAGRDGADGATGATGPRGADGATGPKGDKGDRGDTGAMGPAGADGAQGEQGLKGDKGDKGDQGETGAVGPVSDQVSGTSDWGANLLGTGLPLSEFSGAVSTRRTATIDLSGELDSILVVVGWYDTAVSRVTHKGSVEVKSPSSEAESHTAVIDAGRGGTSADAFSFTSVDFSFPTPTGANAQIRVDQTSITGTGQNVSHGQILGVYKKTRIVGVASSDTVTIIPSPASDRIGFSVSGVAAQAVSNGDLTNGDARLKTTNRDVAVSQTSGYHKLSFTKFGDDTWATVDADGNIRFVENTYNNVVLRVDFPVAQLTLPSSGNSRIELGLVIVQKTGNTRVLRKEALGQYMRNNAVDPPFRTINLILERSLTLPEPFAGETWEVYLYAESQVTNSRLRINAVWEHTGSTTGSASDSPGGGAYLLGVNDLVSGAKGDKGDKGDQGDPGTAGATGARGPQGLQGVRGPTGSPGERGAQGVQGPAGAQGTAGRDGADGADGARGPAGATGAQGPKGDKGDQGDTGAAGATGAQGEQGDPGPMGATGAAGPKGDKGDQGDTGAQGPIGDRGPAGVQGERGIQGERGEQGIPGPADGPAGPAGEKGDKGDQGDPGPAGADGTNGRDGADGAQGPRGDVGPAGPRGADGTDGRDGLPGRDGADGEQGAAGMDGINGVSPWSENLLAGGNSLQVGISSLNIPQRLSSTINLENAVEILVVADRINTRLDGNTIRFDGYTDRTSMTVLTPMAPNESHAIHVDEFSGAAGNAEALPFQFPVTSGANAQIAVGAGANNHLRIVEVRKRIAIGTTDNPAQAVVQGDVSSRVSLTATGIAATGISYADLEGTAVRGISTSTSTTVNLERFYKLSMSKSGDAPWVAIDSDGNFQIAQGTYEFLNLLVDLPVATDYISGLPRIGMALVKRTGAAREIVKLDLGGTLDASLRSGNASLERVLKVPDPFVAQTYELYLYARGGGNDATVRINSRWNGTALVDNNNGGADLFGVNDRVELSFQRGAQVLQGPKGDTGVGEKGDQGEQGIQGIQGPMGIQGETGPAGEQGVAGPKGDKGDQGEVGPQGERGEKGDQGEQGTPGSLLARVQGITPWSANLLTSGALNDPGHTNVVGTGRKTATINLEGALEILVIADVYFNNGQPGNANRDGTFTGRGQAIVVDPSSEVGKHSIFFRSGDEGSGVLDNDRLVGFSFPVTSGANASIRLDEAAGSGSITYDASNNLVRNTGGVAYRQLRIVGVYKKTAIQGVAQGEPGPRGPGGIDTEGRALTASLDTRVEAVENKNTSQDTAIGQIRQLPEGGEDGQVLTRVSGAAAWAAAMGGGGGGLTISGNLLTGDLNPGRTATIDLTGAKFVYFFKIDTAPSLVHVSDLGRRVSGDNFTSTSFPNSTLTANAQIRNDSGQRITTVLKLT